MYEWCEGRKAPKQWKDAFTKTAPETVTEIDKAKENILAVSQRTKNVKKGKKN